MFRSLSSLELLTDPAEGSLLGQIIQINYWWGGAAICVTMPTLPDCCCADLILDCWTFRSEPFWLMSAAVLRSALPSNISCKFFPFGPWSCKLDMPCLMTAASHKWVYTMMKVSDYEVLAHSVVASLGVVLGLGYLQSLLIQNTPHGAP